MGISGRLFGGATSWSGGIISPNLEAGVMPLQSCSCGSRGGGESSPLLKEMSKTLSQVPEMRVVGGGGVCGQH